jgi:hypothetical protein
MNVILKMILTVIQISLIFVVSGYKRGSEIPKGSYHDR